MFDSLHSKMKNAFNLIRGKSVITKKELDDALRQVRMALLEADVNFKVAKEFCDSVAQKALGEDVLKCLTPDKQIIKIVNEGEIYFRTWGMEFVRFDSEKKRYYIYLKVKIDTKINNPESRFFNRSKSKTIWRKRVKEAYSNLVNNGFDIPVWNDYELVFEQKI